MGSLFGITIGQAMWYYIHYPDDNRPMKLFVRAISATHPDAVLTW